MNDDPGSGAGGALAELPAAIVVTDAAIMAPHLRGWRGDKEGRALALLRPRATADVQQILRWAAKHHIGVVPQGGNTSLVGGSVPEAASARPTIVLSLERMRAVGVADPHSLALVAEAGAVLDRVHEAATAAGCRFPLSLGSRGSATVGGLVSTNAGGVQVLRHGQMRNLVLGMEAVLADGTILDQLSALRKDNTGYDVKQLLLGAEGTLGVVTKVALRLAPALAQRAVAWVATPSAEAALALLWLLRRGLGDRVESFELLTAPVLDLLREQLPESRIPVAGRAPFHVLLEVEADDEALEARLAAAIEQGIVLDGTLARSGADMASFWKLREEVAIAEKMEGKSIKNDIAVPVEQVPEFHRQALALMERRFPGARPLVFGHLGDGNLHWNLRPPKGADGARFLAEHAEEARHALHDLVHQFRGSISAEHGIGTLKAGELQRLGDPGKLAAMRALKKALDPENILNPGKLFL